MSWGRGLTLGQLGVPLAKVAFRRVLGFLLENLQKQTGPGGFFKSAEILQEPMYFHFNLFIKMCSSDYFMTRWTRGRAALPCFLPLGGDPLPLTAASKQRQRLLASLAASLVRGPHLCTVHSLRGLCAALPRPPGKWVSRGCWSPRPRAPASDSALLALTASLSSFSVLSFSFFLRSVITGTCSRVKRTGR